MFLHSGSKTIVSFCPVNPFNCGFMTTACFFSGSKETQWKIFSSPSKWFDKEQRREGRTKENNLSLQSNSLTGSAGECKCVNKRRHSYAKPPQNDAQRATKFSEKSCSRKSCSRNVFKCHRRWNEVRKSSPTQGDVFYISSRLLGFLRLSSPRPWLGTKQIKK